ncbi:MAG: rhomboid family intramembrane serine protease [Chitinophagales bacterium]|nr:rhomboid family intramembrane serine protease [Chitinophagales bacterium]MDW8393968.1 rhomboid family intramembrane serine protease [Chitinophagales bacterium]
MSNVLWRDIRSTLRRNDGIVYQLLIALITVFVLLHLARLPAFLMNHSFDLNMLLRHIALPAALPELLHRPWTVITYAFTHVNLLHLLFNALMLFWFGKLLCEFVGPRLLLPLFIGGALAGALFFLAAYNLMPALVPRRESTQLIGASAGAMAVMVAAATLVPDYMMFLLLFGAVRIKWIAVALLLLSLIALPGPNSGGQFAHLGGALTGFLYIRLLQRGWDPVERLLSPFRNLTVRRRRRQVIPISQSRNWRKSFAHPPASDVQSREDRLNRILDKISASGYDALSNDEKEFLRHYSEETERP